MQNDIDFSISGFSFNEVSSIRKSNSKVVCCHFSSDGKLLASAGHDKKVLFIVSQGNECGLSLLVQNYVFSLLNLKYNEFSCISDALLGIFLLVF